MGRPPKRKERPTRITLLMGPTMLEAVDGAAVVEGTSRNEWIERAVEEKLSRASDHGGGAL